MDGRAVLRLEEDDEGWVLAGGEAARFGLVNEYLGASAGPELLTFNGPGLRV